MSYVCWLSRYQNLKCCFNFGLISRCFAIHVSFYNNTQNYCLNVSITWHLQQTYSSREKGAPEPAFIVYWSVLSLWEGLMGAKDSLIKLTLRVTHKAEAAALQLRGAHCTFSSSIPPVFILQGCLWTPTNAGVVSWWCQHVLQQLLHSSLLFHYFSVPPPKILFSIHFLHRQYRDPLKDS